MFFRQETELARLLKKRIRASGPLTFRDFMTEALYDPLHGFYAKGPLIGDSNGPFHTNARYSAFAFAWARAIQQSEEVLGFPIRIIELGGGTGELGEKILSFLKEPHEYIIVDQSGGLQQQQRARGLHSVHSINDLSPQPSFVFGNEVLDALPIHRVMGEEGGKLLEQYVALDEQGDFVEWFSEPSSSDLLKRLSAEHVVLGRGQLAEICLDYEAIMAQLTETVPTGYVCFIDYGDIAENLYHFSKRNGTLRMFMKQQQTYDPYDHVGNQDLTCDVDFTAVISHAREYGWDFVGLKSQSKWLQYSGIDQFLSIAKDLEEAQHEITQLTHLAQLGSTFDVLAFKTPGIPDPSGFSGNEGSG